MNMLLSGSSVVRRNEHPLDALRLLNMDEIKPPTRRRSAQKGRENLQTGEGTGKTGTRSAGERTTQTREASSARSAAKAAYSRREDRREDQSDERQERRRNTDDLDTPVTEEGYEDYPIMLPTARASRSDRQETYAGRPRRRGTPRDEPRSTSPLLYGGVGAILLIAIYSLVFGIVFALVSLINIVNYGPVPTSYTHATLNGHASTIIASNVSSSSTGNIYITIIQKEANGTVKTRTYPGPQLDADAWGGDLKSIVPTVTVDRHQNILVTLTGGVNYFHFFSRPQMSFTLKAEHGAYSLVLF
jgi:hypothetical protein